MKISISKPELNSAVAMVIRATASRPSVPTLSGILITTEGGNISLFASDLETSIKTAANGLIEESGSVVVPGRIFSDIVRALPESSVLLETEGDVLHIQCGQSKFTINTLNAADFTRFPEITGIDSVTLPGAVLTTMVKKVGKSVSRDETRAILTGILLTVEGAVVKMVATDSYRLALVEQYLDEPAADNFEVLVPGRSFDEVVKMSGGAEQVAIAMSSNQVSFTFGDTIFITRRLEGNFPNYRQLIPKEWKVRATANHTELMDSVKRVSLLASNNASIKFSLSDTDQTLTISSKSHELGNADESIMVKVEGGSEEISFNHAFVQDGLAVIDSDFVTLEVTESVRPGIIRSAEENFLYLMMPVRPS